MLPAKTMTGFVVAILAVVFIAVASYLTLENRTLTRERVTRTIDVLRHLEALASGVSRRDLQSLLARWSAAAAVLQQGNPVGTVQPQVDVQPPTDTGEAYGLSPASLTEPTAAVVLGSGATLAAASLTGDQIDTIKLVAGAVLVIDSRKDARAASAGSWVSVRTAPVSAANPRAVCQSAGSGSAGAAGAAAFAGFRLRMRTRAGRAIVSGRRRKGRRALSA